LDKTVIKERMAEAKKERKIDIASNRGGISGPTKKYNQADIAIEVVALDCCKNPPYPSHRLPPSIEHGNGS
jgi:hypothetical protein